MVFAEEDDLFYFYSRLFSLMFACPFLEIMPREGLEKRNKVSVLNMLFCYKGVPSFEILDPEIRLILHSSWRNMTSNNKVFEKNCGKSSTPC